MPAGGDPAGPPGGGNPGGMPCGRAGIPVQQVRIFNLGVNTSNMSLPGGNAGMPGGGANPGGRPCGSGGMPTARVSLECSTSIYLSKYTHQQGNQAAFHPEASGIRVEDQQEASCLQAGQTRAARCSTWGCSQIVPRPHMSL